VLVRRLLIAVALYIPLIGSALAQEKSTDGVLLKWEFKPNQVFYQTMDTETKQTMTVMGMNHTQNQKQTFVFSWTPKEQDKEKNWIVIQKIEAVKMNIDLGGNKVEFDSNNPASTAGNPLGDFFKALVGSEFTLHISPEMKVIKIDGRDKFQEKLIKANPQMEPLLKQILSDDALKQMAEPAFGAFPPHAVKKGEKWTKDSTLNMGPIGSYVTKYTYTYEGKQDKFDKISVVTDLKYQEPGAAGGGALPFQIKAAKLESKGATGTILFDNEKHRVDQSDTKMKLEGKLTISIGGMNTEVDLVQDQTTTVKTSDTKPGGK
jgi:hypothetical protein